MAVCFGEVRTWCNGKFLPLKAISRGFKSRNLPLHNKLNVKLFSMTSSKLLKKWEFCALDSNFFTKGEMEGEKTYALPESSGEMEGEKTHALPESSVMKGGEGPNSYVQNSTYQRGIVEAAIEKTNEAIANHFDINALSISPNPICIADLGCSTGPNTFIAMQNIVEAIKLKYISKGGNTNIPDLMVFFNDQVSNDFNTLFKSLPPNRQYFATGVPGSFHGLLFPKASLHFIHSSSAVHFLSNIPMDVMDEGSPAWNKGRIFYTNAPKEVKDAYATQFAKDMESILFSRAQELVTGGLLALILSCIPDVMSNSESHTGIEIDMIGSCLMDMAKVGFVNEAKVDAFNIPLYYPTPKELKALIERSGYFSFERMAILNNQKKHVTLQSPSMRALYLRAPFEGLLEKQFGNEIMDELFNRYTKKVARSFFLNPKIDKTIEMFVLLKRKI